MELKQNTTYVNRHGHLRHIVGPTKVNPAWYWSLQGLWYEQATGNHVSYRKILVDNKESGEHYVLPESAQSLEREATENETAIR